LGLEAIAKLYLARKFQQQIMQDYLKGLNEPQREAATHINGPLMIVAGAGKTYSNLFKMEKTFNIQIEICLID
jgi:hypothetical protein